MGITETNEQASAMRLAVVDFSSFNVVPAANIRGMREVLPGRHFLRGWLFRIQVTSIIFYAGRCQLK